MSAPRVVFCHGLESGPHGRKYHALVDAGLAVDAPDFRGEDLPTRVEHLRRALAATDAQVVLVGSSFGGATAVLAAHDSPCVRAMVLCAPALRLVDVARPAPTPCVIVHGTGDDVCPIEHSRAYAEHDGVRLIEVDDDHRLAASMARIVDEVRAAVERLLPPRRAT